MTHKNAECLANSSSHRIDIECPIKKGYMDIYKEVKLPKQVPPGTYTVLADVQTSEKKAITCMQSKITFPRH